MRLRGIFFCFLDLVRFRNKEEPSESIRRIWTYGACLSDGSDAVAKDEMSLK